MAHADRVARLFDKRGDASFSSTFPPFAQRYMYVGQQHFRGARAEEPCHHLVACSSFKSELDGTKMGYRYRRYEKGKPAMNTASRHGGHPPIVEQRARRPVLLVCCSAILGPGQPPLPEIYHPVMALLAGAKVLPGWQVKVCTNGTSHVDQAVSDLVDGDVLVWTGLVRAHLVPWVSLRARQVFTILYNTERTHAGWPCASMDRYLNLWIASRPVNEIWDYSKCNIQACAAHRSSSNITLRYVPPGLLPAAPQLRPSVRQPASRVQRVRPPLGAVQQLVFIGDILYPGRLKCWKALSARLGSRLKRVDDAYSSTRLDAVLAQHSALYLNLHKQCQKASQPVEALGWPPSLAAVRSSSPSARAQRTRANSMGWSALSTPACWWRNMSGSRTGARALVPPLPASAQRSFALALHPPRSSSGVASPVSSADY